MEIELSSKQIANHQLANLNSLDQNVILITNNKIRNDVKKKYNNKIVIDREKLKSIAEENKLLNDYVLNG